MPREERWHASSDASLQMGKSRAEGSKSWQKLSKLSVLVHLQYKVSLSLSLSLFVLSLARARARARCLSLQTPR